MLRPASGRRRTRLGAGPTSRPGADVRRAPQFARGPGALSGNGDGFLVDLQRIDPRKVRRRSAGRDDRVPAASLILVRKVSPEMAPPALLAAQGRFGDQPSGE